MKKIYSDDELFCNNEQKAYSGDAGCVDFLLGGIGTGNVSLGARGNLTTWQIFNQPGQLNRMPYTFFSIWMKQDGGEAVSRVLESKLNPPFNRSQGFFRNEVAGLPRFDSSVMTTKYPFVNIEFRDEEIPVQISLEAYTPFIPLNAKDSGIPGAYLNYKVKNTTKENIEISIAGSMNNAVGFEGYNNFSFMKHAGDRENEYRSDDVIRGIMYTGKNFSDKHITWGNMALSTTEKEEYITKKPLWYQGQWTDGGEDFWQDFSTDGRLNNESIYDQVGSNWAEKSDFSILHFTDKIGSLCITQTLKPGEEKVFPFILSWYFPNRPKMWIELDKDKQDIVDGNYDVTKNYYATLFEDAWNVASYLAGNADRLYDESAKFAHAFFDTTLPGYILEAAADNITVMRSPTCFRIENGDFLGWEGVDDALGCGPGNCTHVWNYAQSVAVLFPELEQSMRRIEFVDEIRDDGYMPFRAYTPFDLPQWEMTPAADGQLGCIIRLYREWVISGNDSLIKECWNGVKKTLDYTLKVWDCDEDGVLEQPQHVTYDTELYGISSMATSIYIAALTAAAEMAEFMEYDDLADRYRKLAADGADKLDKVSWNGEFYEQVLDNVNAYRYQYGKGCLSDQLLGQYMAFNAQLGYILPEEHVKKAVQSVFEYNFVEKAKKNVHAERAYILNDEKGLTPCTWPNGGKPIFPFVYYGEVWTGIEYEVAALLVRTDQVNEALTIVKALRDRQDGFKRNPFSENESGYYYTRAMASWAVYEALLGYHYDMRKQEQSFEPKLNEDHFDGFWCNGRQWGVVHQRKDNDGTLYQTTEVLYDAVKM